MKYKIGTKYRTRGKRKDVCTIVDMLTTYNLAGEVVNSRYVSIHEFLGQTVFNRDVAESTIAMGLIDD